MILKAYSKGLYSNWYYYAPDRLLFDCGEGVSLFLRTGIFAIEKIFLSHGHMDHIAGLPCLLSLRHSTKGDNEKPLDIYYPAADRNILTLRWALEKMVGHFIGYPLHWHPVEPGDRVPLRKGRELEAYAAAHPGDQPLGFRVLERRKRLKESLRGRSGPELAALPAEEKFSHYEAIRVSYSGDSMAANAELHANAELLIHDCTFLLPEDRNGPTHAALQEVFDLARDAAVRRLVLCHISPRYEYNRRIRAMIERADSHGIDYAWIPHHRVFEL